MKYLKPTNRTVLILSFFLVASLSLFGLVRTEASIFDKVISIFRKDNVDVDEATQDSSIFLLRPNISNTDVSSNITSSTDSSIIKEDGIIKAETGSMRMSTEKEKVINDTINVYEIKKGDTLDTVAKLFDVNKNTIIWANNLKSNTLTPGDTLLIFPADGVQFTAKKDVYLSDVAKAYNADLDEIATYNGIAKDSKLSKGQSVFLPDAEGEIAAEVKKTPSKEKLGKIKEVIKKTNKPKYTQNAVAGYFMKPVSGCVRTQGLHGSAMTSVDLGCPVGTPVVAAAAGTVIKAAGSGYNGGYGEMVIITHPNGSQTIYAHLSAISVSVGQQISQGQVIGATGNTGRSTGPHLHFETRGIANPF